VLVDGALLGWRLASGSPHAPTVMPAAAMTALTAVAVTPRRICGAVGVMPIDTVRLLWTWWPGRFPPS
jgi:hypothetical protein